MSAAVFRAMLLGLVRDPGALVMSFLVPPVFFFIFASIISGAAGEDVKIRVALADEVRDDATGRLAAALDANPALERVGGTELDAEAVRGLVRRGSVDVGLIIRGDAESLGDLGGFGDPPLLIVADPSRGVTAPMLAGQTQRAYFSALPDLALGSVVRLLEDQYVEFTAGQGEEIAEGLAEMRELAMAGRDTGWSMDDLLEREDVVGQVAGLNQAAYYAGAVAVLFLLFSCVHGAVTLLEENESGVMDRILAGPGSTGVLVNGKFLFLTMQGSVQVAVIFVFAWAVHGVDLPGHLLPWALTTVAAAGAAAGLTLAIVSACRTRRQAQTLANVAVLILSAMGGSMVPRFLMPPWLRELGWLTPNTWALEAYTSIFWRGEAMTSLWLPWLTLVGGALAGLLIARRLARRLESL